MTETAALTIDLEWFEHTPAYRGFGFGRFRRYTETEALFIPIKELAMHLDEHTLTNHQVTVCLAGGAVLGPFNATWSKDRGGDARELVKEYDAFLQGQKQKRFKFFLNDTHTNTVHTLILNFEQITGICDHVFLLNK